ncbi:MAG TPA: PilZ domain-containing protein [Candidatus Acidoferrales bacterium]|nr:PilZ domain-containing protein [Candidatus Acidoferrales bacterium]
MPIEDSSRPVVREGWRRERYSAAAAEQLREAKDCQFSFLPFEELAHLAGFWYEACAEAMVRGNYSALDRWIRTQAQMASEQGFELVSLLELLRVCRRVAIEKEGWNSEQFHEVDTVINECLAALSSQVSWKIPEGLDYITGKGRVEEVKADEGPKERRTHNRSKLKMPIRISGYHLGESLDEYNHTLNVARGGLYFISQQNYARGIRVVVTYPYSREAGAINVDYPAEIVRVDALPEDKKGVAVKFLVSLGKKGKK